ncbi:MAG TPA: hypothetical protein PKG48_15810, partial [Bacteroidales bacterium]|nr:hypothetical protein [Bacteroidales bacterium]
MDTCIPKTTLDALISLMDEPDEQAFGKIHERILLLGNDAIRPLESALENTFQPVVRDRIASLLHLLRQARLRDEIEDWIATGSSDLLKGFILVTRTEFPGLDEQKIVAAIEQLRVDIWVELHDSLTSLENVRVMNHVIFDIG